MSLILPPPRPIVLPPDREGPPLVSPTGEPLPTRRGFLGLGAAALAAPALTPSLMEKLRDPKSPERIAHDADRGQRSFARFFRSAWPHIDPAHLLWNWHLDLVCDEMELAARRLNREIVINIPPRSLKSQIIGVAFPAWVWTWHPQAKFITASNEMRLATRDAVRCRRLVQSEWYQARWGPKGPCRAPGNPGLTLELDQNNKTYFETNSGGSRYICSPGSNVVGQGADYILCDDPHVTQKAEGEAERDKVLSWWFEAIPSRLNEPDRGVKIVVMQRLHRGDVAGECITRGYHKVVIPMRAEPERADRHPRDPRTQPGELLHPERTNAETLGKLEAALGSYATAGQMQQRPAPRDGGMFQRRWFQVLDTVPAEVWRSTVRRWDLAATIPKAGSDPDWTAGVKMGKDELGRLYILDIQRFRESPARVDMSLKAVATSDGNSCRIRIPQDPGQAGKSQAAHLVRWLAPYDILCKPESGAKEERARGLASQAEMGNVFLLKGSWNEAFLEELNDFPNGAHDDQVDAAAGAFHELFETQTGALDWIRGQAQKQYQQQDTGGMR